MDPMDDLPAPRSMAERFRFLREGAGLSRTRLSQELRSRGLRYCSAMQIRRYESGEASPSVAIVEAVAELGGASAAWIVSGRSTTVASGHGEGRRGAADRGPHDGPWIVGQIEAELARLENEDVDDAVREALEIVGRRVERLRAAGRLDDAGYACWLAVRRVAALVGGGGPEAGDIPDGDMFP